MQAIFDYIDQNTSKVVFYVVMLIFCSGFFYEFKNAESYDGDDF